MLQCQQHLFRVFCVTPIHGDWSEQVFFAQNDVMCHAL